MKIVQIATAPSTGSGDAGHVVYALTDTGSVFQLQKARPAGATINDGGLNMVTDVGSWSSYWKELPSIDKTAPIFKASDEYKDIDPKQVY